MAPLVVEAPEAPIICPDCHEPVVAVLCRQKGEMTPAAAAALRDVILAAHRKLSHPAQP